jgi:hypothetical protein
MLLLALCVSQELELTTVDALRLLRLNSLLRGSVKGASIQAPFVEAREGIRAWRFTAR